MASKEALSDSGPPEILLRAVEPPPPYVFGILSPRDDLRRPPLYRQSPEYTKGRETRFTPVN